MQDFTAEDQTAQSRVTENHHIAKDLVSDDQIAQSLVSFNVVSDSVETCNAG